MGAFVVVAETRGSPLLIGMPISHTFPHLLIIYDQARGFRSYLVPSDVPLELPGDDPLLCLLQSDRRVKVHWKIMMQSKFAERAVVVARVAGQLRNRGFR